MSITKNQFGKYNRTIVYTYTLTNDNSLKIHYIGESDADTILNMTNHAYFNLNGHSRGSVGSHSLHSILPKSIQ